MKNPQKLPPLPMLDDERIGHEARAVADDHIDLKIWLRLLACSTQIQQQINQLLRARFSTTLARFDYLAQLERHPDGLRMNALSRYLMVTGGNITGLTDQLTKEGLVTRMNALSRYLMVTGGNITGLTDQLTKEGLVTRMPDAEDRRSFRVALTPKGHTEFMAMAAEHEAWLTAMFDGLGPGDKDKLYDQLGRLRVQLAQNQAGLQAAAPMAATRPLAPQENHP